MSNSAPDPLEPIPLPIDALGGIDAALRVGLLESSGIPVLVRGRYDLSFGLRANQSEVMVPRKYYEEAVRILSEAPEHEAQPDSGPPSMGVIDHPKDETFNRLFPWVLGGAFVAWLLFRLLFQF
jgi:hypothetical protein